MRGKHTVRKRSESSAAGSPPHARETPLHMTNDQRNSRITPACAGNTVINLFQNYIAQDHPRMRGKHCLTGFPRWKTAGSPPHARETRVGLEFTANGAGITPACAGNTDKRSLKFGLVRAGFSEKHSLFLKAEISVSHLPKHGVAPYHLSHKFLTSSQAYNLFEKSVLFSPVSINQSHGFRGKFFRISREQHL